jgi:hypothetical protein
MTNDADAIINASSVMRESINFVADKLNLPSDWLNDDFKRSASYTDKLVSVSKYYRTFSNIISVRTIDAEYLIAMKLMSGRQYKYDLSDVVGIMWEHDKKNDPITGDRIETAVNMLYGKKPLPAISSQLLNDVFSSEDYALIYKNIRKREKESKEYILEFQKNYPDSAGVSADEIIKRARQKRDRPGK